jgi:hypothetical protein
VVECKGCVVKCRGLCGQVQGFVWSSSWGCVHHVLSYLRASGQVGGFVWSSAGVCVV